MHAIPRRTLFTAALLMLLPGVEEEEAIRGFTAAHATEQRAWETQFASIPNPDSLRSYMRHLTARPHHVGSPWGRANAEWLRAQFRAWGWEAEIETFQVLFPTPIERRVELLTPRRFVASLKEPAVPGDPTTAQEREQLPPYNAYSADGDVTAPLVYVNYGIPGDYEALERLGVSVAGKIVIARYGGSWRGIKPKVAAEHGAVGTILFSDPGDDGYVQGETYPDGEWRPSTGVQRGSVMDMPLYPGDPLTPGVGATENATRLPRDQAPTIMKIPVLPISYADAQPLLAALRGLVAPPTWRGALPLTYRIGGGDETRVRLVVRSDWSLKPAHNVIARLIGSETPDQWVLRGNHHDAWVNGAADPISGLVPLLEEARALGTLYRNGWRPSRTIVYAAWDAEEPGLIGSTEWAETHATELRAKAIAYLNTDVNGRGFLNVGGSHILERMVNEAAKVVTDPETGRTVWERARLAGISRAGSPAARATVRGRPDIAIDALGSGSDYTPFLQHLGIASLNLGFGGEGSGSSGVYHSIYDSFAWYTRFDDTAFVYGRALAQTAGRVIMRLASADVLPYEFTNLAETVRGYLGEVEHLLTTRRDEVVETNRQLDEGVFAAMQDPRAPTTPPTHRPIPPHLTFAPIHNGLDSLQRAADRFEQALTRGLPGASPAILREVNDLLLWSERLLTDDRGLPGREWFRHMLYAPGFYTGYGVKTLPGVREGLEQERWEEAEEYGRRIGARLSELARMVNEAARMLDPAR